MNTYDVKCPICGKINHSLYLEETDGWMECECCGHTTQYLRDRRMKKQTPIFTIRDLPRQALPAH